MKGRGECPIDLSGLVQIFHTVKKEMKCIRGFRDTTRNSFDTSRKSEGHELIRVVSRTFSCTVIFRNPPYTLISFLTVQGGKGRL